MQSDSQLATTQTVMLGLEKAGEIAGYLLVIEGGITAIEKCAVKGLAVKGLIKYGAITGGVYVSTCYAHEALEHAGVSKQSIKEIDAAIMLVTVIIARNRCFVAGTQVLVPDPSESQEGLSAVAEERSGKDWLLASGVLCVAVIASEASDRIRRKHDEECGKT